MPIAELKKEQFDECVNVIRAGFTTVAKDFGLTEQNCPTHTSFIKVERLERDYANGCIPFGYYHNDNLIGYVSIINMGNGTYELNHLAVLPEYRHQGHGKKLLDFCKTKILELGGHKISIGIIEENKQLKNYYEANGFVSTGTKRFDHLPFTVGLMEWQAEN